MNIERLQTEFEKAQKDLAQAREAFDGSPAARLWVTTASLRVTRLQANIDKIRRLRTKH